MDNFKLSIIIPVYNIERYLPGCIESIFVQDFKDFELLLIDDGSTDSSGKICDEYSLKDQRVKVYHQENAGVSAARNLGIQQAKGKWLCFIDGDDLILPNSLLCLVNEAEHKAAEMLIAKSFLAGEGSAMEEKYPFTDEFLDKAFSGYELLATKSYKFGSVCVGIFNNRFIKDNEILFARGLKNGEDSIFVSLCYLYAKRIFFSKTRFYLVNKRQGSASQNWDFERVLKLVDNLKYLDNYKIGHPNFTDEQNAIIDLARYGVVSSIFNVFRLCFSWKNFRILRVEIKNNLGEKLNTGKITLSKNKVRLLNFSLSCFALTVLLKSRRSKITV